MSDATFNRPGGGDPTTVILQLAKDAVPTEGDALYAAQRQRTRIIERTLSGLDVDGSPFEPYSQTGPYYYYPNGRVGKTKAESRRNKAAVSRLLRRLNDTADRAAAVGVDLGTGGVKTRNGEGIRFESYADFKASLGRTNVDLLGPRAPHMLQAIAIGANIERVEGDERQIGLDERPQPATQLTIGIYGEEAGRATAHNTGYSPRWRSQHQRRFLGASASDLVDMVADITKRCLERLRRWG